MAKLEVEFLRESGNIRPLTLILGANGSGKTSVLQAIAFVLSTATRKSGEFAWPGFLIERVDSDRPTRIELELGFEHEELVTTYQLFDQWRQLVRPEVAATVLPPDFQETINIIYEDGLIRCRQGDSALSQCLGRYFIRMMLQTYPLQRLNIRHIGDVFWFDQYRNISTSKFDDRPGAEGLRQHLIQWYAYHSSPRQPGQKDYLQQLESQFALVFPGTMFVGVEPKPGLTSASTTDSYFLLQRDSHTYDLAEMSSGEQAVFPLIYEFVRFEIAHSIVLLDELELHLHPPEQQTLLASLRTIGPDCQFIVTSHSPYLEAAVPDEEKIRLKGGLRCL